MKELKMIKPEGREGKSGNACCAADGPNDGTAANRSCCPSLKYDNNSSPDWIVGRIETPAGTFHKVAADWSCTDRLGSVKSRVSAFRMTYRVEPGLYGVGDPGADADVFVSANYKLSFDMLRKELKGINAWILVLDTKGINVWCAAGKGSFGTDELVRRVNKTGLSKVVNHRRLIVPQLGAVGVNARSAEKKTGFKVFFGPVHVRDIPAYLKAGYKKTDEMRKVRFTVIDRLVLTPMEINPAMKKFPLFAAIMLLIFGLQSEGVIFRDAWTGSLPFLLMGLLSVFSGAFLTPVLLPFIPFRSFAVKGWLMGMLLTVFATQSAQMYAWHDPFLISAAFLFFPMASSYIALQFTGSTTFTGMSGVKKELKITVPVYLVSTALSMALLIIYKLYEWEVL